MRYEPPYRCRPCGLESPSPASCPRCGAALLDAKGRRPPRSRVAGEPFVHRRGGRMVVAGLGAVWLTIAAVVGGMLINRGGRSLGEAVPVAMLVPWLVGLAISAVAFIALYTGSRSRHRRRWLARQRARFARLLASAGAPRAIGELSDHGPARFCGRVEVLSGIEGAAHDVDDHREGGRFLVRDRTGAALFDDDCFELWDERGSPTSVRIAHGDWVEIVGRGRWQRAADHARDYRSTARVFVLDGTPDEPLHVRPLPAEVRVELEPDALDELEETEPATRASSAAAREVSG